ncbi:MAG: cupin domain-containing protein, partial [Nanoarchaeota archaeon]|nr:cupin domain-containing protein [Nanoarchaeota archaeon]
MIKQVEKIWGSEEWLVNTELYCAKFLNLNKGYQCSLHYHKQKDETFCLLQGRIEIGFLNSPKAKIKTLSTRIMEQGEQVRIFPRIPHTFRSLTSTAKLLEISTHHDEKDSY